MTYGDQVDQIEFRDWPGSRGRWANTLFAFDDGQERSLLDLLQAQGNSEQNDEIYGPEFAMTLHGGAGDDVFRARSTENVFEGRAGNDELIGTATYRFAHGWGHDVLDPGQGTTTLDFSGALASTDVVFARFIGTLSQEMSRARCGSRTTFRTDRFHPADSRWTASSTASNSPRARPGIWRRSRAG